MTSRNISLTRLAPIACALSLALLAPSAARAQEAKTTATATATATASKDVAMTAAERQRYVGTYRLEIPGATRLFRVYEENGVLHGQPEGSHPARMLYQGENTFRPEHEPSTVVTFTVADGRATRLKVVTGHGTFEAVRQAE